MISPASWWPHWLPAKPVRAATTLRAAVAKLTTQAGNGACDGENSAWRFSRPDVRRLRSALRLAPEPTRCAYVYAVPPHSAGRGSAVIQLLKDSLAWHCDERDLASADELGRDTGDVATRRWVGLQLANQCRVAHRRVERLTLQTSVLGQPDQSL
jgi:hypothetical protein